MKEMDISETSYKNGYEAGKRDANRWINVKDDLPDENKAVLGYTPCGKSMFVGFYKEYNCSGEKDVYWKILTAKGSTKTICKKVTHWMPLPEPPQESEM